MKRVALPSAGYLRECLDYDPETGELRWKVRPRTHFATKNQMTTFNQRRPGKLAGGLYDDGYRIVGVSGVNYMAHRLVWVLMTGNDPPEEIDHVDGNKSNNRWANLRAATHAEQRWNSPVHKNNIIGRRGVGLMRQKWRARIRVAGVMRFLGAYPTVEEASAAYDAAARELHGEFYRP